MADVQARVECILRAAVGDGRESAVQVAAYLHGELIVDACAGAAVEPDGVGGTGEAGRAGGAGRAGEVGRAGGAGGRPVDSDSLFHGYSTGKGVAATLVHVLAERGLVDLDAPIADLWPEFAAHGKGGATLRDALTHRIGIPQLPSGLTPQELCDWDGMCALVAGQAPLWEPGTATGYHGWSFAWIVGETVRRATGLTVSEALRRHVTGPLGIADSLLFGVPADQMHRVVPLLPGSWDAMLAGLPADAPLLAAVPNRAVWPAAELANRPAYLAADVPAGGTMTARAVARMYAALLGEVDGVRLLPAERLPLLYALQTAEPDRILGAPVPKGLGYFLGLPESGREPTAFGHQGSGGSIAFADPRRGLAFAFTRSRLTLGAPDGTSMRAAAAIREAVDGRPIAALGV
ncbi:serine hydrolase domain-containing protein [Streptomyces sp. NPDC046866]|uniref:serine hydrolase domain-containing protein n=1 Tax=Streptomyces sp. NPDC046866 TaxID=3154921 RepID=UPI0034542877